jgi:hypothetical protein
LGKEKKKEKRKRNCWFFPSDRPKTDSEKLGIQSRQPPNFLSFTISLITNDSKSK